MTNSLVNFLALALYLAVAGLLWVRLSRGQTATTGVRIGISALGLGAVVLHATILANRLHLDSGLSFALTDAVSLVAWVVAVLFLIATQTKPVDNLGIVIMPVAALTILVEWFWPGNALLAEYSPTRATHVVVSIIAYSLLTLAAFQSLLLLVQERHLHAKHPGGFIRALPPLQTMESLMFQMVSLGFLLLTLTLVSGVFFSEQVFGQPLKLTHHILLSVIAWGVFGILLAGRRIYGWRGRMAVRWTLAGFALLLLAYFGSKFVLEILLERGA
jgi:ABC-type uncharacterized transport system permease subunit